MLGGLLLLLAAAPVWGAIEFTTAMHEGAEHFVVRTPAATYWYDRAGGGFSRLMDRDGLDWIGFRREPWNAYPASAASAYRGLPNFVFGGEETGAGHPGFAQCVSVRDGDSIITTSRSGAWRWRWTFTETHARVTIERAGPAGYWFLYEGTLGGAWAPAHWYWGHSEAGGPLRELPDFVRGERATGHFRWAYFGHDHAPRVLFLARHEPDEALDSFGVMGAAREGLQARDGMTVFGFGRGREAKPLLREAGRTFSIGFFEQTIASPAQHAALAAALQRLLD